MCKAPFINNRNNNNLYDAPEKVGDTKFNYLAIAFSEPFTDRGNGKYDIGEVFQDKNGDGKWTAAEEFEDINGNTIWDTIPQTVDSLLQLPDLERQDLQP